MTDNTKLTPSQRALLISVDLGEYDLDSSVDELKALAEAAGAEVAGVMSQRRSNFDNATVIGRGRLEEAADFAEKNGVDLIIFDHELSGSQIRNVEDICKVPVIDRTMLILDIFARNANTAEGRLQVELAQQRYLLPRLSGVGRSLSRQGGGIGTRGPGESKLEADRRHIRSRISVLSRKLDELTKRRSLLREHRKKTGTATVAIVGYTNVGKSTLLNALTDAGVLAKDQLFATLNPTARALKLPDGRNVILIDTVGLVRRLPHHLVAAFRSTLDEAATADLILSVCDASSAEPQQQVVRELLKSIGAENVPVLNVLNKCDLADVSLLEDDRDSVRISALTGEGLEDLLECISRRLDPVLLELDLLIPYSKAGLEAKIMKEGSILSRNHTPDGVLLHALVHKNILHLVTEFAVRQPL